MTGRVQTLRSNVAGTRPTGRAPGELYVNWADNQFGVVNSANAAQDLIAVRYFSTAANYVVGDFVIQGGQLYRAVAASTPGVFVPANWSQIGGSVGIGVNPPGNPQPGTLWWDTTGGQLYVWYDDGDTKQWVVAVNLASALSPATTTALGGVKVDGTSISAAADGTISTVLTPIGDNRIINGDMRIDQRNNGAAGTALGYTVDRWQCGANQTGKLSWQRVAGPTNVGFPYSLLITSSSAYASLTADTFATYQTIEADMVSDFAWGTANARPVTLSFWAGSSLTGTFSGVIRNAGNTRSYPFTFSIPVAGTWAQYSITIPGDTAGAWVMSGNAAALFAMFDLGSGATYRGPAGAWASANYTGATGAVSVVATNGATFFLTGVKLEIGSVATPFNRQSLAKSMADCQRYFAWANAVVVATGNANVAGSYVYVRYSVSVPMRAAPTVTAAWGSLNNATAGGVGLFNDARTLQGGLQSIAAGGFSGNLTVTSFSAEL